MAIIQKPEFSGKGKKIPAGFKLILLVAVILGLWVRSCWKDYEKESILFENIRLENPTSVSVDVHFTVINNTIQDKKQAVIIKILTDQNEVIASKMTQVEITAKSKTDYLKVIDKFDRALLPNEKILKATIEIYQKSFM